MMVVFQAPLSFFLSMLIGGVIIWWYFRRQYIQRVLALLASAL